MLFGGRRVELLLKLFDDGGDVERLHAGELTDSVRAALSREAARGVQVGLAGVVVADVRGEEFQHALCGLRRGREDRGRGQLWGAG